MVKALSRNNLSSSALGKDGVVPLITNIITKLARNQFGPRLKVAVEALCNLSKIRKKNSHTVLEAQFGSKKFIFQLFEFLRQNYQLSIFGL